MPGTRSLYEADFYQWAQQQAALLRAGKWHELDHDHLAEEIEDLAAACDKHSAIACCS